MPQRRGPSWGDDATSSMAAVAIHIVRSKLVDLAECKGFKLMMSQADKAGDGARRSSISSRSHRTLLAPLHRDRLAGTACLAVHTDAAYVQQPREDFDAQHPPGALRPCWTEPSRVLGIALVAVDVVRLGRILQ